MFLQSRSLSALRILFSSRQLSYIYLCLFSSFLSPTITLFWLSLSHLYACSIFSNYLIAGCLLFNFQTSTASSFLSYASYQIYLFNIRSCSSYSCLISYSTFKVFVLWSIYLPKFAIGVLLKALICYCLCLMSYLSWVIRASIC